MRKLLAEASADSRVAAQTKRFDEYIERKVNRLADLRKANALTQAQIAVELGVSQAEVSKLEHRETHMVETLLRLVAASGGRLRMVVEYDDGTLIEYTP
ncbi:MAG: helix-turn-helix transcriptional regulator [Microthrixaceae bacterium]